METRTFKLHKDYWDCGNLYTRAEHTFNKGITVLVGCNGSGKSTTLTQIKEQLRSKQEPYFAFDNVTSGGSSLYQGLLDGWYSGGVNALCSLVCSSEGEKIHQNILIKAQSGLGAAIKKAEENGSKELFLLWDAVDSGASIDNIIELKDFFNTIIKDQKEKNDIDVFVIVSANSYEMANGEACYDISHNKYISFNDYEEYKKFILKSRKFKERRLDTWSRKREAKQQKEEEKRKKSEETVVDATNEPSAYSHFRRSESRKA